MDSIDIAYVESGSVQWGNEEPSGAAAEVADEDLDEESGGEGESGNGGGSTHAAVVELPPHGGRGVEEEKGGEPEEHQGGEATATAGSDNGGEGEQDETKAQEEREEKEQHRRSFNFATELFFLTHRALQVIVASLNKRQQEAYKILGDVTLSRTGLTLLDEDEGQDLAAAPLANGRVAKLQLRVFKEASSAMSLGWALEGFGVDAVTGHACQLAIFTASWLGLYIDGDQAGGIGEGPVPSSFSATFSKVVPALIETMCSSWVRAAFNGRGDQFLTRKAAEDAAQFCGQIMERVSYNSEFLYPVSREVQGYETFTTATLIINQHEYSMQCVCAFGRSCARARGSG